MSSDVRDVRDLREVDRTQGALVGGKGAHLGELSRIEGISVPPGFCVTTGAFRRAVAGDPAIDRHLDRLARLGLDDREAIGAVSAVIRRAIEAITVPPDLAAAITGVLSRLGDGAAVAVRSSATAEDLPTASFAGQHDTYLNVLGPAEVLRAVVRCWASLFTDRAVAYRVRHGIDHRATEMAVVVQQMVLPDAAGILFTADPVSGNRTVATVEASVGLGEALVSGRVDADAYEVRHGEVTARTIGTKQLAVRPVPGGGTEEQPVDPDQRARPALTDDQVLRLVERGRRIEAHLGGPQDIEWCLTGDDLHVVQSRPVTTLFPIPAADDGGNHVYVSVGHQQMMTDPITPLGLSVWKHTAFRPMVDAGGRLFVDVTRELASPTTRDRMLALGQSDPLIGDALQTIVDRDGFLPPPPDDDGPVGPQRAPAPGPIEADPAIVVGLIERTQASIARAEREIRSSTGTALLDVIDADIQELRRVLFDPQSHQAIMAGMEATWWLNDHLAEWLGEVNAADTLTLSVPHNVTSEMGLALLDVADAIRPHPEVVAFLAVVEDDDFLERLPGLDGGPEARAALEGFLDRYGMRGVGEIDVTRPRWRESPRTLLPAILGNVRGFDPGAGEQRFEAGRREAAAKEREVLERLRALPDGDRKADETKRMIDRVRTFAGYREYPKYGMVCRYFLYKQALLAEADRLARAGLLREREDLFYLSLPEIRTVVAGTPADDEVIRQRREAHASYATLTPPRVLTSDGEVVAGAYRRDDVPDGALGGLAVSAGTVEGRARVVDDIAVADLERGDILVTAYTDPSWSPLFVSIAGLVTEVGGLMTHGAVVAREYGLPAVVGVEGATQLIRDGQRIRVHGTHGFVELLAEDADGSDPTSFAVSDRRE